VVFGRIEVQQISLSDWKAIFTKLLLGVNVSVFFGLEKAYDTTWKYGILRDLHELFLKLTDPGN